MADLKDYVRHPFSGKKMGAMAIIGTVIGSGVLGGGYVLMRRGIKRVRQQTSQSGVPGIEVVQ